MRSNWQLLLFLLVVGVVIAFTPPDFEQRAAEAIARIEPGRTLTGRSFFFGGILAASAAAVILLGIPVASARRKVVHVRAERDAAASEARELREALASQSSQRQSQARILETLGLVAEELETDGSWTALAPSPPPLRACVEALKSEPKWRALLARAAPGSDASAIFQVRGAARSFVLTRARAAGPRVLVVSTDVTRAIEPVAWRVERMQAARERALRFAGVGFGWVNERRRLERGQGLLGPRDGKPARLMEVIDERSRKVSIRLLNAARDRGTARARILLRRPEEEPFWADAQARYDRKRELTYLAVRDCDRQRRLLDRCRVLQSQIAGLKVELLGARDAERRRLRGAAHDLKHKVRRLVSRLEQAESRPDAAREALAESREALTEITRFVEHTSVGPERRVPKGLKDAIESATTDSTLQLPVSVECPPWGDLPPIEPEIAGVVERFLVEALRNAQRHQTPRAGEAPGMEVVVTSARRSHVQIVVRDRGVGFDPSKPIPSLAYLVENLPLRYEIGNSPTGGCEVRLWTPARREGPEAE